MCEEEWHNMFWMQWRLKSAGVCIVFILAPRVSVATHLHFLALLPPPSSPRLADPHQHPQEQLADSKWTDRPEPVPPRSSSVQTAAPQFFVVLTKVETVTHQRRPATTSRSADNCSAEKSLWGPPPPLHSSPRFCNLIHRHLTLHLKHRVWGVFFRRYDVCNFSVDFWGEGAEG